MAERQVATSLRHEVSDLQSLLAATKAAQAELQAQAEEAAGTVKRLEALAATAAENLEAAAKHASQLAADNAEKALQVGAEFHILHTYLFTMASSIQGLRTLSCMLLCSWRSWSRTSKTSRPAQWTMKRRPPRRGRTWLSCAVSTTRDAPRQIQTLLRSIQQWPSGEERCAMRLRIVKC